MKTQHRIIWGLLALALVLASHCLVAQVPFNNNIYGKNRVQYKTFDWKYLAGQNFDVFYYDGNEALARTTAQLAEANFASITDMVGFAPYTKVKIFVYQSVMDLHQSNVGVNEQNVAGQTTFSRSEIEIAYPGAYEAYQDELRLRLAEALIFEMMYGGNLRDMLQNTYLLSLPDWFMAGAARYIAHGWNAPMDDYMRDMLANRKMRKISNMEGEEAHLVGQSIWNYIVEKYGKANVANILNLTRIVRNEESSIQNTLGISFQRFINNWRTFYIDQAKILAEGHRTPATANLLKTNPKGLHYNLLKLSPRAEQVAYAENDRGRYAIKVRHLATGKEKRVLAGGYQVVNQLIDKQLPLFAWQNEEQLAVINTLEGQWWLWSVNTATGNKTKRPLPGFSQIVGMDVADNGKELVMSAVAEGTVQNDLYLLDLESGRTTRLTNDRYDDLYPVFLKKRPGAIAFSSNRSSDTLGVSTEADTDEKRLNIFMYNPRQSKTVLKRVSNTLSHDVMPVSLNEGSLVYLSDQRGIDHLYRYDFAEEVSTQISNFSQGMTAFDVAGKKLAAIMVFQGKPQVFLYDDFNAQTSVFTPKTNRQQLIDLRRLATMRQKAERQQQAVITQQGIGKLGEQVQQAADTAKKKTDEVDTENYQFDTFTKTRKKKLLKNYRPTGNETADGQGAEAKLQGPFDYESKFRADNLVTSIVIDPLRGWGLVMETSMNDALENHKFNAGLFGLTSLRSGMYYMEYKYLKGRLDYKLRFDRQNLSFTPSYFTQRYVLNRVQASVSYPLNVTSRFTAGPFVANTNFSVSSDVDPNVQRIPERTVRYGGLSGEFVYDNSIVTGPNVLEGNRLLVRYEQWLANESNRGFSNLLVDARAYRKLGRTFVFASRFSYGQFFGGARKTYRLGGMSNWIVNSTDPLPSRDPLFIDQNLPAKDLTDLLFAQYVTNLRGFNWNKLRGNTYVLFNAELRMPLLKYFYKSALTSNFLKNLQLVAFTDIGAAWTGLSPFNRENALNTIEIDREPFFARVSNFKNPFLIGVGTGLRTMLLGYYTKFDIAWGIENETIQPAVFYITLGYDF